MARDTTAVRAKATQSHADAIDRQLKKIRDLERNVEELKEKEALRLFQVMEQVGWIGAGVPDEAFAAAMDELVTRYRDGGTAPSRDDADAPTASA